MRPLAPPSTGQAAISKDDLVYLDEEHVGRNGQGGMVAAVRVPEKSWREATPSGSRRLAPERIQRYPRGGAKANDTQLYFDWLNKDANGSHSMQAGGSDIECP